MFLAVPLGLDVPNLLLAASSREFCPDVPRTRAMLRVLRRRFGVSTVAALLSVPEWLVQRWLASSVRMFPRDRKLIWLVYSLIYQPGRIRSPFDVITCGRFSGPKLRKP